MMSLKLFPVSPWIRNLKRIQHFAGREFTLDTRIGLSKQISTKVNSVDVVPRLNLNSVASLAQLWGTQHCRSFASRRGVTGDPPNDNLWRDFRLMNFPPIVWPSIIKSFKNWLLTVVVIRPYIDHNFSLDTFQLGARQAMLYVSTLLYQGNFERLQELISAEALAEIKENYPKLNLQQRYMLNINERNIYFGFPYQVGIILEEIGQKQKRFLEITMCFHCLLNGESAQDHASTIDDFLKYGDKIIFCNCRFIKEFTKGAESDWTMNVINFFRPQSFDHLKKN